MQQWMTVIDAAIQGVPEQAQRRKRVVTNHFSFRGKGKKMDQSLSTQNSTDSLSESMDERGLDLSSSTADEAGSVAMGITNLE